MEKGYIMLFIKRKDEKGNYVVCDMCDKELDIVSADELMSYVSMNNVAGVSPDGKVEFYSSTEDMIEKNNNKFIEEQMAKEPRESIDDGLKYEYGIEDNDIYCMYVGDKNSSKIVIPHFVEKLCDECFSRCENIEAIEIPDTVKELGESCFMLCNRLKSVKLGKSLKIMNDSSFSMCKSLEEIDIPDSVEYIGDSCFDTCVKLKSVKLGKSVRSLGVCCFLCCEELEEIELNDGLEYIGEGCFEYTATNMIKIPKSVKHIGNERNEDS